MLGQTMEAASIERAMAQTPVRKKRFWMAEIWSEQREIFKLAVTHVLVFAGLVGSLEVAHWLLQKSSLPPEELYWLNKVHFYGYAFVLGIFIVSFIIKVWKAEFPKKP